MLSGLKFIPRDQLDDEGKQREEEASDDSIRERKKSSRKDRNKKKKKKRSSSRYSSSDDELERIKRKSRKKKKWFDSEGDSFSSNSDNSGSDSDEKKHRSKNKKKQKHGGSSEDDDDTDSGRAEKNRRSKKKKQRHGKSSEDDVKEDDDGSLTDKISMRKELGLEWMLRPTGDVEKKADTTSDHHPVEPPVPVNKTNPRELNPYLKDNGTGFPEDSGVTQSKGNSLMSSAVVGDGGASWRLKALKRAQEQAAREGRNLGEVVEERWGSLGQLAVSVSSRVAAPARAHLHASKNRHREMPEGPQTVADDQNERTSERDVPYRNPKMSAPKAGDSISWGKRKKVEVSNEDSKLISSAVSSLNKFVNNGSFMHEISRLQNDNSRASVSPSTHKRYEKKVEQESSQLENGSEDGVMDKPKLSANQLAAKCLQLRMKGKHEEAEKLMKEAENAKANLGAADDSRRPQSGGNNHRYGNQDLNIRQKKYDENADMHLAHKIIQNKQYSISSQADDEYDYDEGPRKKTRKKGGNDNKSAEKSNFTRHIMTQQERCQFCFENPTRPRHLIIAIANLTYLMLPQWQPVVPGHCCILPMQHESSTRTVDNDVWDEIRNFKKCLIMMFAEQEKEVVFLETVMGLARQRRHCLIECIPLPREIAKQAPLYFKKAIDEAEDEWSQHNAKKLIDTSEKGLRGSIPKDFPYFHVEFGLNKGFVHVIDDENEFKGSFGLNVMRGMLRLPVEDMHRQRRHESVETQKQAVASFARNWEPFDWTKQLD